MYKLARKHIVISPKPKRVDMEKLRTIIPVIIIAAIVIVIAAVLMVPKLPVPSGNNTSYSNELKQFNSFDELKSFLKSSQTDNSRNAMEDFAVSPSAPGAKASAVTSGAGGSAESYSTTNVQVEGVDEPDIVKNDGKYIYTLSGEKITIVEAYPADEMKVLSTIKSLGARNIFLNNNKLVVFSDSYETIPYDSPYSQMKCAGFKCDGGYSESKSVVSIYDISDRTNPVLVKNISFDGNYVEARMVSDYVYIISSKYIYTDNPVLPAYSVDGVRTQAMISDVYYYPYMDNNYVFTSIGAIDLNNYDVNSKTYLTGSTSEVYVSEKNIYLTYQKSISYIDYNKRLVEEVYMRIAPDSLKDKINQLLDSSISVYEKNSQIMNLVYEYSSSLSGSEKEDFDSNLQKKLQEFETKIAKEREQSVVHKISFDKMNIEYKNAGSVPGHVLNQFSMDEYNGYFRIATTTGNVWNGNSLNNVYILDKELELAGKIEGLAPGEKIYSARFLGDRGYIVTFKKVDPLFVIDLKNPENPRVLGYLKIPGYSDYLHPYDENHVIGVGKDAADATSSEVDSRNLDFAWYQGVKISLFDVSDVEHPIEQAKFSIGDRGSDSPVLSDHKALLFDKEKNLLVIPVSVAEINRSKYHACTDEELKNYNSYNYCLSANTYGEVVWQGAYVLSINDNSIELKGKITHDEPYNGIRYGAAKDEPIGAERTDSVGNIWVKQSINQYGYGLWRTNATGYENSQFDDYNIDMFPGGINYRDYIDYSKQIQRSLYMNDVLYTVSQAKIKSNNLNDISEIKSIDLGYKEQIYPLYGRAI